MSDASRYIPEHRRAQHKGRNQFRGDELRRRREDQQVEIRKQKKEENLAKRRNLDLKIQEWDDSQGDVSDSDDENSLLNKKVSEFCEFASTPNRVKLSHYSLGLQTN